MNTRLKKIAFATVLFMVSSASAPGLAQSSMDRFNSNSAFGVSSSMRAYSSFNNPGLGLGSGFHREMGSFGSLAGSSLSGLSQNISNFEYGPAPAFGRVARSGFGNLTRLDQLERLDSAAAFTGMQGAGALARRYNQPASFTSSDFYAKRTTEIDRATSQGTGFGPIVKFSDMNKVQGHVPNPVGVYPPNNAFNPMQSYTSRQSGGQ